MNTERKIEIARNFVDLHDNTLLSDWDVMTNRNYGEESVFLHIYWKLMGRQYGAVEWVDDHYEIEISGSESKSGSPILYTWS